YFWGASDIDNINDDLPSEDYPGLGARDGVLVWNDIDVSGLGNLRLEMAVAQGQGTFEPDNHFRIQIRFDAEGGDAPSFGDGEWITIGGFRSTSTNTPGRYFAGPLRLVTEDDPRLTSQFQEWAWDIWGFGDTIDMRIIMNSNWRDEDYYVDNVRLIGDDAVNRVAVTLPSYELTEPTESESVTVTFTAESAAPAGGLTLDVMADDWLPVTLPMPETVTIPEGQTTLSVDLDHVADGRFTGEKIIEARFSGDGISRESLRFKVENTTPKPEVLIMEVLNVIPGTIPSDLEGDANGDGASAFPGDQFVELVNFESFDVDVSGWTIHDDLGPRHEFPEGTIIPAGRALVTFGGGTPVGIFGGADVLTVSSGTTGFAFNSLRAEIAGLFAPFGGEMEIIDLPFEAEILEETLQLDPSNPAYGESTSYHRTSDAPDGTFELHSLIGAADNALFSPGARVDGTPYFTPTNTVNVSLSADTASETDGAVQGDITLGSAAGAGGLTLTVSTNATDDEIALSASEVTVPEGQTSASFTVTPINDNLLDGDVPVTVVVEGPADSDVLGGFDIITITDVESNPFTFEITEFLIDLDGTGLDPNLDGNSEQAVADQFIEIVNRSGFPVHVGGWSLVMRVGDEFATPRLGHRFAPGTVLNDEGAAVIFGEIFNSDVPDDSFGGAFYEDASNDDGNGGLHAQAGDAVFIDLVNEFGFPILELEIPSNLTAQGQSVAVVNGTPQLHLEAAGSSLLLVSPGTAPDGTPYAGNGAFAPAEALTQIEAYSPPHWFLDGEFGWVTTESYPWVWGGDYENGGNWGWLYLAEFPWVFSQNEDDWWWYFDNGLDGLYFFSTNRDRVIYTEINGVYPFVFDFELDTWIDPNAGND
ncbi:MAG: lamin tail domain-containing protein, partial [Opitutales bacterium]